MVTFHIYFKNKMGDILRMRIPASGSETAIKTAKELVNDRYQGFEFDGRVTRLFKSWQKGSNDETFS